MASIVSAAGSLLGDLVRGDGLDDVVDGDGRHGLLVGLVLGDRLGDLLDLGRGELLADLGERRGERVVDPALGLLDGVGHRVAALRPRATLGPRTGRGGRAAAPGRRPGRRLLGLLEAEPEAMALGVERDDLELERLALVDDVARMGDPLVGQLADVDQALEPVADAHERAEVDELRDGAVDDVADLEVGHRGVPRVRLQATDRQADPAALVVDVDDLGLDLLADLVAGLGVVDLVPGELALVDETVDPAEVDEDAERRDRAHGAGDLLADLEAAEQLVALLAALLVEGDLLGQDEPVGLAVDLEDLEPELAADERLQLLGDLLGRVARLVVLGPAREVDDLADRHEAADAAVDDEAALVVVDDRRLDDHAGLELLLHRAPLALEAGPAEREDDVALLRLGLEHVDEDDVADGELRLRLGVAPVQLAVRDDALALRPDVDEDLVLVDPDDRALDDVTVLEALDVGVLLGEQLLHRGRLGPEVARQDRRLVAPRRRRPAHRRSRRRARRRRPRRRRSRAAPPSRRRPRPPPLGSSAARPLATDSIAAATSGSVAAASGRRRRSGSISAGSSARRRRRSRTRPGSTVAIASASGAVPPCCSSVNGLSWSVISPQNQDGPSDDSGRGRRSVGPCLLGLGPLLRVGWRWVTLFCCPAREGRQSLARADRPYNRRTVPELPDLTVVVEALPGRAGRAPDRARGDASRRSPSGARRPSSAALVGQRVAAIRRRGKFLLVDLDRDRVVVNPMLTGRFQLAAAGREAARRRPRSSWASEPGRRAPADAAVDPRGRLAARPTDAVRRSATATRPRWARSTSCRPASTAACPVSTTTSGPTPTIRPSPSTSWRARIRRHPGELKNLLKNQAFVAGIGNAYSDEILHAAGLLPVPEALDPGGRGGRRAVRGDPDDARATRSRSSAVRVPPTFETQVRDFLAVHGKGGTACPRCGTRITEVQAGRLRDLSYCRGCQR